MRLPAENEENRKQPTTVFRKQRRRSSQLYCRIDVTGFLSIQLVLLYMFIINSSNYVHPHHLTVNRVPAAHSRAVEEAEREDALIVAVVRDGKVFFDRQQMSVEELPERIDARIQQRSPRTVFIDADARVHYRQVMAVLDAVRQTKANRLVFLTGRPQ